MTPTETLIADLYAAFNRRDIDAALAYMTDTVSWPRASEGGRITGKQEIRAYWTRQWAEFDPHVHPLQVLNHPDGTTHVRVHQLVKSLSGNLLSDTEVWHIYTLTHGLISRMDLREDPANPNPTSAFTRP